MLTLVVVLVVVRPLVKTILGGGVALRSRAPGRDRRVQRRGPSRPWAAAEPAALPLPVDDSASGRMLDIARVNGQVQARSIERIGEMVKDNTAGTVTILRQWIHEGS